MTPRSRILTLTRAVAAGTLAVAYTAYRKDIKTAKKRIETGSQIIESPAGPIEFGETGDGPAVLVIHGAGGGFDQGLDLGRIFLGDRVRIIAPSRFGYLGTPVPEDASAEAQADAHARLLDALNLDCVPVIGVSAGAPSAMQLCLRHPDRCSALVLVVPLAYPPKGVTAGPPSRWFQTVLAAIASSDVVFWMATKVARAALLKTILGTPVEDYRAGTAVDRDLVGKVMRDMLPISKRTDGLRNDGIVGSTLAPYPLERMRVPTLILSAADCLYGTYESSLYTAEHIRSGKIIAFPTGGHLLLGHDAEVRSEIANFLREAFGSAAASPPLWATSKRRQAAALRHAV